MPVIPFADRPPTAGELERLRLLLSTYQDGTGMLRVEGGGTLPGWRDFERSVAVAFGGEAQESKAVFDVLLSPLRGEAGSSVGLSCKMRSELDRVESAGRVLIELSNAAQAFWAAVKQAGVTPDLLAANAPVAGLALSGVIQGWHNALCHLSGGAVDLSRSCYLVLLYNQKGTYCLFQFPLTLWDATKLRWEVTGKQLRGRDEGGVLVEWYFNSGGQLKLYPLAEEAAWRSGPFRLEPLPARIEPASGKAAVYFPEQWLAACQADGG